MTTAYTSLLGLALPVTGELSGTWGDTVNNSITSLLDSAVAGTTNVSTDGDVTLTTTTGAANTAREAILLFSGARTALRTVTAPAQSKIYTVINATTGGFSVKLVGAGPTTGVTIVAGESAVCAWNGSDFVKVSNAGGSASFTNVTVSGTTTLSGLTASTALALNASKEVVSITNTGTGNNVLSASPTLTGTIGAAALTLSSDLTLSGGTANGVAYLNGSKVVTSGSALTFDGTDLATTGGVRLNNSQYYYGKNAAGSAVRLLGINSGNVNYIGAIDSGPTEVNFGAASSITAQYWNISGSEGMRLTSTGLGIGTSSPATKLEVTGDISGTWTSGATRFVGSQYLTGSSYQLGMKTTMDTRETQIFAKAADTGGYVTIATGITPSERVRIDGSGNVGIGTSSPSYKLQVIGASQIQTNAAGTQQVLQLNNSDTTAGTQAVKLGFSSAGSTKASINAAVYGNDYMTFNVGSDTERMRIDSSGNLGLGVTPSAWSQGRAFELLAPGMGLWNGSGSPSSIYMTGNAYFNGGFKYGVNGEASHYYQYLGQHVWSTAPSGTAGNAITFTQAMTLDSSGNLGIGTSSPTSLSNYKTITMNATTGSIIDLQSNGTTLGRIQTDTTYALALWTATATPMVFGTNYTERMRLDSAGNLGLGVTPSAWGSTYKAIQLPSSSYGGGSFITDAGSPAIAANAYNNSGWKYVNTDFATIYQSRSGQHQWFNAPSGTAGNAITFTQAMTLDANGNLAVGTTTPQNDASYGGFTLNGSSGSVITLRTANANVGRVWASGTDFLNIDANGTASGTIIFRTGTGSTERARIDSSGNLLVGTTSNSAYTAKAVFSASTQSNLVVTTSGAAWGIIDNQTNAGTQYFARFDYNNSLIGSIQGNNTTTSYNTSSDYRLKNTIAPMTGALAKVALLKPCTYKWNADGSDGEGFIAHELAEVCPQAVTGEKDAVDEEGNPKYQGIDTSFLVATLTAAIQEQQEIINSLKARLDAANL